MRGSATSTSRGEATQPVAEAAFAEQGIDENEPFLPQSESAGSRPELEAISVGAGATSARLVRTLPVARGHCREDRAPRGEAASAGTDPAVA
jgi:hypothetical protein